MRPGLPGSGEEDCKGDVCRIMMDDHSAAPDDPDADNDKTAG